MFAAKTAQITSFFLTSFHSVQSYIIIYIYNIIREFLKRFKNVLTRRVHTLRETDFRRHWRVDFWYLKMKPSVSNSNS